MDLLEYHDSFMTPTASGFVVVLHLFYCTSSHIFIRYISSIPLVTATKAETNS